MIQWKRVKSATEWGFFFGVISWLLATGISNKMPAWGVWGIILSRTLMGFIIGIVRWEFVWWLRGLILGAAVSLPLAFVLRFLGVGWGQGFWPCRAGPAREIGRGAGDGEIHRFNQGPGNRVAGDTDADFLGMGC